MQDEGKVGLGLGGEHARRGEAVVVDERWIVAAFPFHGIGRIGDDGIKRFVVAEVRVGQGVAQLDVELVVVDVVQEHVHPRQVVRRVVDLLAKEPVLNDMGVKVLLRLQQQRTAAAGGVVDLVDAWFACASPTGQ